MAERLTRGLPPDKKVRAREFQERFGGTSRNYQISRMEKENHIRGHRRRPIRHKF